MILAPKRLSQVLASLSLKLPAGFHALVVADTLGALSSCPGRPGGDRLEASRRTGALGQVLRVRRRRHALRGGGLAVLKGPKQFANQMPGFPKLSDADAAALLTYVRATYGKDVGAVSPAEVKAHRRKS